MKLDVFIIVFVNGLISMAQTFRLMLLSYA